MNTYVKVVEHENSTQNDIKYDIKLKPPDIMPFTELKVGDEEIELGVGSGSITGLLSWLLGGSRRAFNNFLYN